MNSSTFGAEESVDVGRIEGLAVGVDMVGLILVFGMETEAEELDEPL